MSSLRRFSRRAWLLHAYGIISLMLWPLPPGVAYWTDSNQDGVKEWVDDPADPQDSWWNDDSDGDVLQQVTMSDSRAKRGEASCSGRGVALTGRARSGRCRRNGNTFWRKPMPPTHDRPACVNFLHPDPVSQTYRGKSPSSLPEMSATIKSLLNIFPANEKLTSPPADFSLYDLSVSPPADLVELFELYGNGTFTCATGDPIRIFKPDQNSIEFLDYVLDSHHQVMMNLGEAYDTSEVTIPASFFTKPFSKREKNIIYWGHSSNGVILCSIFLSSQLGWASMLLDGDFQRAACYFKASHAIIRGAFMSGFYSCFFPKSSGPYSFESEK